MTLTPIEPLRANIPYARTVVAVRKQTDRRGQRADETRYFLSSLEGAERTPEAWVALIRGHWAGVEIRNHWRRDTCWMEDKTRSRNPNLVGALILLRSAVLALVADNLDTFGSLPAFTEACAANPQHTLRLLRNRL